MRLFHVSEEENIAYFEPRIPARADLDQTTGLVWAIDERRLPNFLTPHDCPRVAYHIGENTVPADIERFFSSATVNHVLVIESKWFEAMNNTCLCLYEFDPHGFVLQDDIAGYYISTHTQKPVAIQKITNLPAALFEGNIELRIVDRLWDIADHVKQSTLNWSLCRMAYAQER